MKGRQVILGPLWGRKAAALMVDGRLEELTLDSTGLMPFPPGAILRGVVDRLVKGQGGVFLRLPDGTRGFLRAARGLSEGRSVVVQVAGAAEAGKALPVTQRVLIRGRHVIATPDAPGVNVSRSLRDPDRRAALEALGTTALSGAPETLGLILRSAAAAAEDHEIAEEAAEIVRLAMTLDADRDGAPELLLDGPTPAQTAWRDWGEPYPNSVFEADDAFEASGASDAAEALLRPDFDLPGGASASIEPTRALVAVDVNTGPDTSPAAGLKANIALARDLPRQLRLRGLGGQVIIDFAPVPKRDRGTLDQALRAAFRSEGRGATLSGWTAMGLYELARQRDRLPLARFATTDRGGP